MTMVPWAALNPTRELVASALPTAPTVREVAPNALVRAWRGLVRPQH